MTPYADCDVIAICLPCRGARIVDGRWCPACCGVGYAVHADPIGDDTMLIEDALAQLTIAGLPGAQIEQRGHRWRDVPAFCSWTIWGPYHEASHGGIHGRWRKVWADAPTVAEAVEQAIGRRGEILEAEATGRPLHVAIRAPEGAR